MDLDPGGSSSARADSWLGLAPQKCPCSPGHRRPTLLSGSPAPPPLPGRTSQGWAAGPGGSHSVRARRRAGSRRGSRGSAAKAGRRSPCRPCRDAFPRAACEGPAGPASDETWTWARGRCGSGAPREGCPPWEGRAVRPPSPRAPRGPVALPVAAGLARGVGAQEHRQSRYAVDGPLQGGDLG